MKMIRASVVMGLMVAAGAMGYPRAVLAQQVVPSGVEGAIAAAEPPQVKDELFAGTEKFAQGATRVSEINMDKNMLGMVKDKGKGSDMANKMDFVVVHSYSYDKPGMYKPEDVEAYRKKLTDTTRDASWNCFIHTREKDSSTDICQRTAPDNETHEMVVMTASPRELTFIHLRGRMSLDDLGRVGRLNRLDRLDRMGGGPGPDSGESKEQDKSKDK